MVDTTKESLKMGKGTDTQGPCPATTPHRTGSDHGPKQDPHQFSGLISPLSSLSKNQEEDGGSEGVLRGLVRKETAQREAGSIQTLTSKKASAMIEATVQTQGTASS